MQIKTMKVTNFSPNFVSYNAKQQSKTLTANPSACQVSATIPSKCAIPAFTGLPPQLPIKKSILPEALQKVSGEIFGVNIIDKLKKETVKCFLRFTNYGPGLGEGKALMIYSPEGKMIGSVGLDFSEWEKIARLPKNHTRLQYLRSDKKDQYAGVGSTLIQAAIEQSLKTEAKGRIYVHARNINGTEAGKKNDPFMFYNKMGLSVVDPNGKVPNLNEYLRNLSPSEAAGLAKLSPDQQLVELYKTLAANRRCKTDAIHLDFAEMMFLPDDKVQSFWLPKIQSNPIFSDANRLK